MELTVIFRSFAQVAAPAAVTALWQGGMLAAGLAVCLRLAPRVGASDRFRAWATGFWALFALPFLPLLLATHAGSFSTGAAIAASPSKAWFELDPRWALAIAGAWIAASTWRIADLAVHSLKLRAIWKDSCPISEPVAGNSIFSTRQLDRPCVIGFFRPRILIPDWLLSRLTVDELEQVVLHEAEHLRRRDDWTNLAQKLALVVFPLNPALAWIERQLCHEREIACDDAVVRATGEPRAYAACLASLAERGLERRREALALGAWRQRPELVARVHRLLKYAPILNPVVARALLAVVGSGLLFGAVEFSRAPQLVEFDAAPVIARSNVPDLVNSSLATPLPAGYKVVDAIAQMPAANRKSSVATTASRRAHATPSVGNQSAEAGGMMEVALTQNSDAQATPQWIVFTAWERVVAVNRKGQVVADYEFAPSQYADSAVHESQPVRGWAVTELLLRVDPAKTNFSADSDQDSQPGSQPAQPTAIPLRDGWLVFQL
jgi:hypothetical protein